MRALLLSLVLVVLLTVITFALLAPLELSPGAMLIPAAIIILIAGTPYAIAEVRRADREARTPPR